GSVHPWLLGQFITAHVRVLGRSGKVREDAKRMLAGPLSHMRAHGLGQLCELFDGDSPHRPGGAIASAAAVAELLRCYVEDILDLRPQEKSATTPAEITITLPKAAARDI